MSRLGNDNNIARLQNDVLFQIVAFFHIAVLEGYGFQSATAFPAQDLDFVQCCIGRSASGHTQGLHDIDVAQYDKFARLVYFADDVHLVAR